MIINRWWYALFCDLFIDVQIQFEIKGGKDLRGFKISEKNMQLSEIETLSIWSLGQESWRTYEAQTEKQSTILFKKRMMIWILEIHLIMIA